MAKNGTGRMATTGIQPDLNNSDIQRGNISKSKIEGVLVCY